MLHLFRVLANFSCHFRADGFMAATELSAIDVVEALLFALIVVSEGKS